jgi:anti-sigma regulatory factor (Ser/Thr protein kinase)
VKRVSVERLDLPAEPASVRAARVFVTELLDAWGCTELTDTAALLTSELATNVVLHARTPFAVVVARTADGAQVDVLDSSPTNPAPRTYDVTAATGRGLALVEHLAQEWGRTPEEELAGVRKGVRFSLA